MQSFRIHCLFTGQTYTEVLHYIYRCYKGNCWISENCSSPNIEFWFKESFNKGLCLDCAISWTDKHSTLALGNTNVPWSCMPGPGVKLLLYMFHSFCMTFPSAVFHGKHIPTFLINFVVDPLINHKYPFSTMFICLECICRHKFFSATMKRTHLNMCWVSALKRNGDLFY